MFTACPHCQFLVARDPHSGASPADCARCGKPLVMASEALPAAPSLATLLHASSPTTAPGTGVVDASASDREAGNPSAIASVETTTPPTPTGINEVESAETHDVDEHVVETAQGEVIATVGTPPSEVVSTPITETFTPPTAARKVAGPRFLHRARTTPVHTRRTRVQWTLVVALSLLLCVQAVVADRARLATLAGWRPIVMALCGVFRCEVPTWREPAAFTMLSRDVRPLPGTPGILQAQATFRNEARWAQAWPVILLTLKDADGRTLGARALQPDDYLPDGGAATAIGPGQSAQMAVRIREPSANVVAFSFDFR